MKRREFEKRVKDENLKMESYDIALDHYYDGYPHYMGCVRKDRKWVTYATEDEAFSDFYLLIKSQIKAETLYGPPKRD